MTEQAFGFIKEGFARAKERVLGPKPAELRALMGEVMSLRNIKDIDHRSVRIHPSSPGDKSYKEQ